MALPEIPDQLYGSVTIDGAAAVAGMPVTASIKRRAICQHGHRQRSAGMAIVPNFFPHSAYDTSTPAIEGGVNETPIQMYVSGLADGNNRICLRCYQSEPGP